MRNRQIFVGGLSLVFLGTAWIAEMAMDQSKTVQRVVYQMQRSDGEPNRASDLIVTGKAAPLRGDPNQAHPQQDAQENTDQ